MNVLHYAISAEKTNKQQLDKLLCGKLSVQGFENKKGLLFSDAVLEKFMEEEAKHDNFELTKNHRSIRSFSSGERKKILLEYLLSKNPDFLVLENPFESLDVNAVAELKARFSDIAKYMSIFQIYLRREDVLPFISLSVTEEASRKWKAFSLEEIKTNEYKAVVASAIPPPLVRYKNVPEVLVAFTDVNVAYFNKPVLHNINWTIKKKEFWQLIGPNGSGKSTILSMIYGNNTKAYGQNIELFGRKKGSGESVWEIKQKMGYFNPAMLDLFKRPQTAEQMLLSGFVDSIGLYSKTTSMQKEIALNWLQITGLLKNKDEVFQKLSPVKQRLLLIARAMIKHPALLILDEPLTNLDEESTNLVVQLINKIASETETTILFVSHRTVAGLHPQYTYRLTPNERGSVGVKVASNKS